MFTDAQINAACRMDREYRSGYGRVMTGTRAAYMRTYIKIRKHARRARLIEMQKNAEDRPRDTSRPASLRVLALPLRRMQSGGRRCERQAASATAGCGSRTE